MKTRALIQASIVACGLGFLSPFVTAASADSSSPVALKVQVNVPASWNLLPGEPFPEFIAASISDALARQGLRWPIAELRSVEDPAKAPYLLKIDITEWRRTGTGDLSCTLAATLRTPQGERQLGVYSDTHWAPGVIYKHSRSAYFPTRLEPIRALYEDLKKSSSLLEGTPA